MAETITRTCRLWGPWAGHPKVVDGYWNGCGDLILERHLAVEAGSTLTHDDWDFDVPRTMDPNEALGWELDRSYEVVGCRPSAWLP